MKLLVLGGTRFLGRHLRRCRARARARRDDLHAGRDAGAVGRGGHAPGRQPRSAHRARPGGARHGGAMGCRDRHQRLRSALRAGGGRGARRARRALHVRLVAVRVRGREPPGRRRNRARRHARRSAVRGHRRALRRAQGALRRAKSGRRSARRALVVRPGLIVGPHRPDRPLRATGSRASLRPELLGARAEAAVVPAPRERRVQFIDARDLASWMPRRRGAPASAGTFDACSPAGTWTMGALVDALVARGARGGQRAGARMGRRRDAPGDAASSPGPGLPLWIPATDPESAGFMEFAVRSRDRAGSRHPAARADDRRHRGVARRARQRGCLAQRAVGREGTRAAGRHRPERPAAPAGRRAIIETACAGRASPPHEPRHERRLPRIRACARRRPPARPSCRTSGSRSTSRTRGARRATTRSPSPITRPSR